MPQALEGVAAVALLYAAIKRWFGAGAGLAAGALLALTPVAALMFRFNNPDALLVLAAGRRRLLPDPGAGAGRDALGGGRRDDDRLRLPGQDDAGVPGPAGVRARVHGRRPDRPAPPHRCRRWPAALAIVVSAGWWVAIVALWPASSRPMIDGSPDNSILNLIIGYNGLGRIFGASGSGRWRWRGRRELQRATGVLRLFNCADGRPGVVAAARRAAGARRRPGGHAPRAAHRPHARRAAAVGRLAGGQRAGVQPLAAASSTPTTRWRWPRPSPRWWRSAAGCCGPRRESRVRALVAAAGGGRHRRVGVGAAGSHAQLAAVAAHRWSLVGAALAAWPGSSPRAGWRPLRAPAGVAVVVLGVMACLAGPVAYAAADDLDAPTPARSRRPGPAAPAAMAARGRLRRPGGPAAGRRAPARRCPGRPPGGGSRGARAGAAARRSRPGRRRPGAASAARRGRPGGADDGERGAPKRRWRPTPAATAGWRRRRAHSPRPRWSWPPAASR